MGGEGSGEDEREGEEMEGGKEGGRKEKGEGRKGRKGPEFATYRYKLAIHINLGNISWLLTPGPTFISVFLIWS